MLLDPTAEGVVVAEVDDRSPGSPARLQAGRRASCRERHQVDDTRALDRATRERAAVWRIMLERGGQVLTTAFGGG
jgi:hypothetical protein